MKPSKTEEQAAPKPSPEATGSVSYDDWQNAYEEAAAHVEYVAATSQNHIPEGEREAMRQLAKRIRRNAGRLTLNAQAQARPDQKEPHE